jgi:GTP cyclohydrolase II
VRTRVRVPFSLAGLRVDADVHTFTGLVDGAEHLALGLGDWEAARDAGRVDLLSNNPDKAAQLAAAGVDVVRRTVTGVHLTAANARYLQTKVAATGHDLALLVAS